MSAILVRPNRSPVVRSLQATQAKHPQHLIQTTKSPLSKHHDIQPRLNKNQRHEPPSSPAIRNAPNRPTPPLNPQLSRFRSWFSPRKRHPPPILPLSRRDRLDLRSSTIDARRTDTRLDPGETPNPGLGSDGLMGLSKRFPRGFRGDVCPFEGDFDGGFHSRL